MKITRSEVEHVAHLARLNLSEDELEKMTIQLDTILNYAAKLEELDATGIEPTTHSFSISNAFRDDVVRESLPREESLRNCAVRNDEAFIVPRII
ncbi:Asp-tRNA(Asn)/Glu-tRNA(Gln) amidotransferase subunit GatC [Desulfopila inferna]|uniref:Asp-tRNA(Asn)/Glu-tRNA(Gln) amidotransferase subunit GatC n=1 Tax=Desulfopila inferna TaxID=468528 RepID=UPI00196299E7|nr:Asp-tRNA(Asn)/Glu-tRNA(Gln) amidotransferase subunit GatC [Desulfopila inferna]MBM9603935.1 Asp-tRNA(Asn)/Glu-tRNA(Gln) amidotransferase subunit GatC [Desulfopila inferna]